MHLLLPIWRGVLLKRSREPCPPPILRESTIQGVEKHAAQLIAVLFQILPHLFIVGPLSRSWHVLDENQQRLLGLEEGKVAGPCAAGRAGTGLYAR